MAKNFETLQTHDKSEIIGSAKKELSDLNLSIFPNKDKEKFNELSKDPTVKRGLEKIFSKSCNDTFSEDRKTYEKLHIGGTLEKIIKKYPNLLFEITGNLGLSLKEKDFSKLTIEQKLKFTALYESVTSNGLFDKKNPSPDDILKRINLNMNNNTERIERNFRSKNIKNILKLDKTLREDFKLTESEISKVKEYLSLVQKHPEFVGKPYEAGGNIWGYLVVAALGVLLGALSMSYIENIWKREPITEERTRIDGVTEIENPEKVLKLITYEGDISPDKPIGGKKTLTPNTDDNFIFTLTRKAPWGILDWIEELYKDAQTKEIAMELMGKAAMQFDLNKGCKIYIDVKKDVKNKKVVNKGVVYVQLPYPDIILTKTKAKVTEVDRELIHVKEYDQAQEELRQNLEQQATENLKKKNSDFYQQGLKEVKNQLLGLFTSIYAPSGLEITDVNVKFINPDEGPTESFDPEGRSTRNF